MAAVVAERVGDLTLRLAHALVEEGQHGVVLRRQACRLERGSELSLIIIPSRLIRESAAQEQFLRRPGWERLELRRHGCR